MTDEQLGALCRQFPHLQNIAPNALQEAADKFNGAIQSLITLCGDDPERDGLQETPTRVLKAFLELTEGYQLDPKAYLERTFDIPYRELIIVKNIEFHSMCEHHFSPFFGVVHVGYIPNKHITGLSKIARMVEGYAKRFQVQERLTSQIVEALEEVLEPLAAAVVVEARHMCMCGRGVKKSSALTMTSSFKGEFERLAHKRDEFLALIK
ncbi:GTP cyclohydrolase I FolE [Paenibacillus cremeus]|uniref:GTP cyclohydrolase 1 n=1 Tax=Paenibacillus cremeus TaxID=2163881 RepID=A0A559KFV8_9BACL|nr:GTP cyclohydrolase I FolE [Paenibacillus cremeus]TVY11011.1 GTP cyclohydrolase I FolE [Paenibacillus cremeus]